MFIEKSHEGHESCSESEESMLRIVSVSPRDCVPTRSIGWTMDHIKGKTERDLDKRISDMSSHLKLVSEANPRKDSDFISAFHSSESLISHLSAPFIEDTISEKKETKRVNSVIVILK